MNNKLKNFFAVTLAMCALVMSLIAPATMSAGENAFVPFLEGRDVVITNLATASTNLYGATNLSYYSLPEGTNVLSRSTSIMTNGVFGTNRFGYVFPRAWNDVKVINDRTGADVEQALAITVTGNNANSTNFVTFNFAAVGGRSNAATVTATSVLTLSVNGTTPVTLITNLPTILRRGVAVRLTSIYGSIAAGSTNFVVNSVDMIQPKL